MLIGAWVLLRPASAPGSAPIGASARTHVSSTPVLQTVAAANGGNFTKPSSLWVRPTAAMVSRNHRKSGFAWILRQLGATEKQLDRLADGDVAGVITDLKAKAQ